MTLIKKVLLLSVTILLISPLSCFGRGAVKPTNDIGLVHFNSATELASSIRRGEITSIDLLSTLQKVVAKLHNAGLYIDETAHPDIGVDKFNELHGNIRDLIMMRLLPLPEWLVAKQNELQTMWASFFEHYDVLLAPVSPTVAFPHNHMGAVPSRSLEINGQVKPMLFNGAWARIAVISGLPATVAPVGLSDSGLPVGIQIISDRFEDRTTLAFARGLSEVIGGFMAPPSYED